MIMPRDSTWDEAFRSSPFRLRFELGGETLGIEAPVPRFVQAYGRARQIATEVFEQSRTVWGIVAAWPATAKGIFPPAPEGFQALAAAGFSAPAKAQWTAPPYPGAEDEEAAAVEWRAFDLTENLAARDVLLWCSASYEMEISPKAQILAYLADLERGILLRVYDDRGMDLTALTPEPLLHLYRARTEWLLNYDRERMRTAFE
jgi:hypothetical protein